MAARTGKPFRQAYPTGILRAQSTHAKRNRGLKTTQMKSLEQLLRKEQLKSGALSAYDYEITTN